MKEKIPTYEELARENRRFVREDNKAAKGKKEPDFRQLLANRGQAKRAGFTLSVLEPSLEEKIQDLRLRSQGRHLVE